MQTNALILNGIRFWFTALILAGGMAPVAIHAQPTTVHYEQARASLSKGEIQLAKRELKLSLQEDPLHAPSHFILALLLAREGDWDQAMVGFQQSLSLDPQNTIAKYNLATALLWRGEPVQAARLFEEVILLHPERVPAYINLAKTYFLAGLPELAIASYREALHRDPSNRIARKNLILLTGETELRKISELNPNRIPDRGKMNTPNRLMAAATDDATHMPIQVAPNSQITGSHELGPDPEVEALASLVRNLAHVTAERRAGRLTLDGWTSGAEERKRLDRILAGRTDVVDLTGEDAGDPHHMLEVDAIIFKVIGIESESAGHNFLRRVSVNASVGDGALSSFSWLYSAAISYEVNIANAMQERIAFLARPHLTTLSGTPATFVAGGDIVYKVSGTTSGDIKPYPFGTTLDVTPTLLRTRDPNGSPRIRLVAKAGRRTLLPLEDVIGAEEGATVFENIAVTSEAVLNLNQTLILSGLSQRENRIVRSGVPGLKSIPIIKYLFSTQTTLTTDLAIIILLTPRDPAYWDEQNKQQTTSFVEKRRAFVQAAQGTEEDLRRFKEQYPDWDQLAPNRFASHFFLMKNSEAYRRVSGIDLASEELDFELLGKQSKKKK